MMGVTGIVLAGGKSRRMGTNKALLKVDGEEMIVRLINRLERVVEEIVLVTNDCDAYDFLNVPMVEDMEKNRGPLAGLQAGLVESRYPWNMVVACDLPFFYEKIGNVLLKSKEDDACDAVIPVINGRKQPLFALYHSRVLPVVEKCLVENTLRMKDMTSQITPKYITEEDFTAHGFTVDEIENYFFNMNEPTDYTWAIQQLKEK